MTTPPAPGRNRPTALDVARLAGVSRTTVSFVLNDRAEQRGITEATAQRVLQAAHRLGYLPDRAARMLRSGRSDLVLFGAPGPTPLSTLALHVVTELTDLLADAGLQLLIRRIVPGHTFQQVWRGLSPAAVIGLEIAPADLAELEAAGVPAVSFDVAAFDESLGAAQAHHLLGAGHTALGYVAPQAEHFSGYADRRLAAVRRTCTDAGVPEPVVVTCDLEADSAAAAVRALLDHGGITAVCAYNDEHAFAVLAGMAELGLRAPHDLAVIGADSDPLSAVAVPALTTVDPGTTLTAEHIAHQVLAAVGDGRATAPLPVPAPRVRVRRTA